MRATLRSKFGAQIRRIRTSLKLSQDQLGQKAGTNGKVIGEIERGVRNPTLDTVERILKALQAEPFEAFSFNLIKETGPGITPNDALLLGLIKRANPGVRRDLVQILQDALRLAENKK